MANAGRDPVDDRDGVAEQRVYLLDRGRGEGPAEQHGAAAGIDAPSSARALDLSSLDQGEELAEDHPQLRYGPVALDEAEDASFGGRLEHPLPLSTVSVRADRDDGLAVRPSELPMNAPGRWSNTEATQPIPLAGSGPADTAASTNVVPFTVTPGAGRVPITTP